MTIVMVVRNKNYDGGEELVMMTIFPDGGSLPGARQRCLLGSI